MRIFQVIRGIIRTAVTWALVWAPVSVIPFAIIAFSDRGLPPGVLRAVLFGQFIIGGINGAIFASVVAIAGRRKTFDALSIPWIAACGAVGGTIMPVFVRSLLLWNMHVPLPLSAFVWTLATNALLGAGLSALTLSIARRAPLLPRERAAALPLPDGDAA